MSRAVPHFVSVAESPAQPAHIVPFDSESAAMRYAALEARTGFVGAVVKVYEGKPGDGGERDPVKVWS